MSTTYIDTVDWPPKIVQEPQAFHCSEAGQETEPAGKSEIRTINGHEYCVTTESEGAAGSIYRQYAYARNINNGSVFMSFSLRFPQCGNYPDSERKNCEQEQQLFAIDSMVDQMMSTIASE